jgi:hypothetical protein
VLRTEGFVRAQVLWYTGYSPRYAFTFLVNLVELAGPAIVPALPVLAILTWLVILTWSIGQFGVQLHKLSRVGSAFILAELMALGTLQTAPDLPQSLYWQTGMLTYLLPLMLATFVIGWIRRAQLTWWALLISGAVTFVAGGLSETYLIPQNVAATLALLAYVAFGPRRVGPTAHLAAALGGGVLALVAIVVAPSTASRVGGTPADLWLASAASIATAFAQIVRLVRYFPLTVVLCLAVPALQGADVRRLAGKPLAIVLVCLAITLPFCYFPSFYAQNGNPPARSLIVPGSILIAAALLVGHALQGAVQGVPTARRAAVAVALAVAIPIGVAAFTLPERAVAAQHAALWDAEDAAIRASRDAGQLDLRVRELPPYLGEKFVTDDPNDWFNVCVARYYGVRTIASS